jgi:GrpB-like predicted nucleotidyltransferase (UPF0157 family)
MSEAEVHVVAYDPGWPALFELERAVLQEALAPWVGGAIEHIGSTAVPGLRAKAVIDIMVPVRTLTASEAAIGLLERSHSYHYWPYKSDVMHWLCKPSERHRTHHLHLVPVGSRFFQERLAFRDALREDPDMRARYTELKLRLSEKHANDREAYTHGKAPFVAAELRRLLSERARA